MIVLGEDIVKFKTYTVLVGGRMVVSLQITYLLPVGACATNGLNNPYEEVFSIQHFY